MTRINQNSYERLIDENEIRIDGRKLDELRPINIEVGILTNAYGSVLLHHGRNKVLAAVFGPRELHPRHLALPDRALVRCEYRMTTFSVEERKSPAPSRREIELSKVIRESLEPAIFTHLYPRTSVDVFIEVLQADGGTRCDGITAASTALADAGVPLRDLVVACAVGKVEGHILLDLDDIEDKKGEADMPIAILPRNKEVTLLQMDGQLSREEFQRALDLAIKGCEQIHEMQKEALRKKYSEIQEEVLEELNEFSEKEENQD